ncbi:DUF3824 domain-containing protein [Ktedonobacter robiniae]|uniref:Yip1 domain-containing protein n=1 Tax=Ktedonobacter robiniae TaxID=2778365 RepID=A0ABQ3UVF6_9CHLR|nr:DUF3824 domain-containing protein [Ktedonobacter robiniae]GHO56786.1 hypothetical protein KSB_52610 [Ktedonobacter robiniae]
MQQPPSPGPANYPGSFPPVPQQPGQSQAYPPASAQPNYAGYPSQPGMPLVGYPYPGYPPQPARPRTTRAAVLKYGLIFGAILVVAKLIDASVGHAFIQVLISAAAYSQSTIEALSYIPTIIFTLVYWVIYFLAGLFAARQARNVTAATLTGLLASLCFFVAYFIVLIINLAPIWGVIMRIGVVGNSLAGLGVSIAITLIVQIGLGIGLAALGGLLGKGKTA